MNIQIEEPTRGATGSSGEGSVLGDIGASQIPSDQSNLAPNWKKPTSTPGKDDMEKTSTGVGHFVKAS